MPLTYGALKLLSGLGSMSSFGSRNTTKLLIKNDFVNSEIRDFVPIFEIL